MHSKVSACIQGIKTGHICHAQYSNYTVHFSHPKHHSLAMHINLHYTPSKTHHTAFHNPHLHTANKHKAYYFVLSGGKMA